MGKSRGLYHAQRGLQEGSPGQPGVTARAALGAADGRPATGGFALTARWRSGMVMAGLGSERHAKGQ